VDSLLAFHLVRLELFPCSVYSALLYRDWWWLWVFCCWAFIILHVHLCFIATLNCHYTQCQCYGAVSICALLHFQFGCCFYYGTCWGYWKTWKSMGLWIRSRKRSRIFKSHKMSEAIALKIVYIKLHCQCRSASTTS